jgi:hypothetical protein
MSVIAAGTTNGIQFTNDATGNLYLQYNTNTNGITLSTTGAIGIGASPSYGTAGQALVSNGSGSPPSWGTGGTSVGKAIALDLTFGLFK